MNTKNVIAVIPARGGSVSIPRKNIKLLAGKPLIAYPIQLAKSIANIDRVIVSTDDQEIAEVAREYGAEIPFMRPAELATGETPTLPVLQHCVRFLKEAEGYDAHIVLLLYPTSPFLRRECVEEALDKLLHAQVNSVISVVVDYGRFWNFDESANRYVPLHPKERVNRQFYKPLYREDGAIYFSRSDVLVGMNKLVDEHNVDFIVRDPSENIDIDTVGDWIAAEKKIKVCMPQKIQGSKAFLRVLTERDATKRYCAWLKDEDVNQYLETRNATIDGLKRYIREKISSDRCIFWGIFDQASQKHIGNLKLEPIDFACQTAELGIIIGDKEYWGRGYAAEAMELALRYAFEELQLKEVTLGVSAENTRAIRLYEHIGFKIKDVETRKKGDQETKRIVMVLERSTFS